MLNVGIRMQHTPWVRAVWMLIPKPKPWNSGMQLRMVRPGSNFSRMASTACSASALKFRSVRQMPLGLPLVPPL